MNKIIIGWSFGATGGLKIALKKISKNKSIIIDVKDVVALDEDSIYVGSRFVKHKVNSFSSSFIRYPYDLIPPHTQTYSLRESTEFLKTIALLFSESSLNPISHSQATRNRIHSLSMARQCGLNTPMSSAIRRKGGLLEKRLKSNKFITKSLGNCYFSEKLDKDSRKFKKYLSFEEDGGDTAYIYPAHKILSREDFKKHIDAFKVCFLQDIIFGDEFRLYVIKDKIFIYKRGDIDKDDKSAAELLKANFLLSETNKKSLIKLVKKLKLKYLCLDVIFDEKSKKLTIIDINPYGSLPEYALFPEPTDELARLILKND